MSATSFSRDFAEDEIDLRHLPQNIFGSICARRSR